MLDALFMKYLSKKGKGAYWIGQISGVILFSIYLFGIKDYSLDESRGVFILGIIGILVVWGLICLVVWPKSKEEEYNL